MSSEDLLKQLAFENHHLFPSIVQYRATRTVRVLYCPVLDCLYGTVRSGLPMSPQKDKGKLPPNSIIQRRQHDHEVVD